MGQGPTLSWIDVGGIDVPTIRASAQQSAQTAAGTSNLADLLTSVHDRTMPNWTGVASQGFSFNLLSLVQAKRQTAQVLQMHSSALNDYADALDQAKLQWFTGQDLLNSLPGQLKSQALSGGVLSVAGLGITDPAGAAALLAQAGEALAQLVGAQVKAQAAALQLVEALQPLSGVLDEVESLISGNQSHAQSAPVAPVDVPPWVLPVGLGAGGLGSMVMPLPQDQPIEGDPIPEPLPPIVGDPIPEPLPPILGDPIPEPLPPILGDPIPEPLPPILGDPIPEPLPPTTLPGLFPGLHPNKSEEPGKESDGDGEGQGQGQGDPQQGGHGQPGQGDSGQDGQRDPQGAQSDPHDKIGGPNEFDPKSLEGLTPAEVEKRIPSDWVQSPTRSGGGEVYRDPDNPGRQIRIMPGYPPGSRPDRITWGPYAVVSQGGTVTKVPLAGNPVLTP